MFRPRLTSLALTIVLCLAAGCDGSERGPMVPFKRDPAPSSSSGEAAEKAPSHPAVLEGESRRHEGGPDLKIDDKPIAVAGARASLTLDLDGDGLDDALVWAGSAEVTPRLWLARGTEDGFAPPQEVERSRFELAEGCLPGETNLTRLSADKAVMRGDVACGARPARTRLALEVFSVEAAPRVLERIALRAPAETERKGLELDEVRAQDVDGDGHDDVELVLTAQTGTLRLTWLDRPSGLSLESDEPSATLDALAEAAEKLLESDPRAAARAAEAAESMYAELCRGRGEALIAVADTWGLRCGDGNAAARARLVSARSRIALGEVVAALDALQSLQHDGLRIAPEKLQEAEAELEKRADSRGWALVALTTARMPSAEPSQPPPLRFDGNLLWLGVAPPRLWDVTRREEVPVLEVAPLPGRFADPSATFYVRQIDRDCDGRLVRIGDASGQTLRARVRQEASSERCALRVPVPDAGDLRVLGWAPQGLVLTDREGALLVPLDTRAQPTDPPRRLPLDAPLPAPLPPGRASASGSCSVRPTPYGLLVSEYGRKAARRLVRPEDWEDLQGPVREAVVDAQCRRFALFTPNQLYVIEPSAGAP